MSSISPGRAEHASRLIAACAIVLAAVSCSEGEDDTTPNSEASSKPASEICDGTLTGPAADDLESLSGQTDFVDKEYQSPGPANLNSYLDVLHESASQYEGFCRIYTPQDDDLPYAEIEFGWRESATPRSEVGLVEVAYEAGEFAYAEENSASIDFSCPIGAASGSYLNGRLYTSNPGGGDLQISVLNSVSRAVAEGLGCLEESGLPEGTPERLPG